MSDAPAIRLAVALLSESGAAAAAYAHRPGRPLQGYGLITGDGATCRMTIYTQNLRAPEGAGYLAWLVSDSGAAITSPIDMGPDGEGHGEATGPALGLDLEQPASVRITAPVEGGSEAAVVLEGPVVWLRGTGPEGSAGLTFDEPCEGTGALAVSPHLVLEPIGGSAPLEAGLAEAPVAEAASLTPEADQVAPAPASLAPEPDQLAPPAAAPPDARPAAPAVAAGEATVPLAARHPLASRAAGTAQLNLRAGSLTVTLRGLPGPASLGRESATDRPFNGYRVWLVSQRSGARLALGLCTRLFGENFRWQSDEPLPLGRYDTVLVTADDRTAPHPNPASPQVVHGKYVG